MMRLLLCLAAVAAVGAIPNQPMAQIILPEGAELPIVPGVPRFPGAPQSRQSAGGSSGLPWLQQNSVSEAWSVLFPSPDLTPLECRTTRNELFERGTCLRVTDCLYYGGESFGYCGGGLGSCCVFARKCQETTNMYISHFTNPTFSTVDAGTGECKLTVNPMHSNICQYRLDFDKFNILGPDRSSNCVDDFFGATGGSSLGRMCGNLEGSHVYINVKPGGGPIILTMDTSLVRSMAREWDIKVTQIPCDSPNRAPSGCLQFYNTTSGVIRSFNFARKSAPDVDDARQLQNMNYGICINSNVGYCDVTYTRSTVNDYTFSLTGNSLLRSEGEAGVARMGTTECTTDFITIPGAKYMDPQTREVKPVERFCGSDFPEVKTAAQPYVVHVVTNADEEEDGGNLGFEINFRQNLCYP